MEYENMYAHLELVYGKDSGSLRSKSTDGNVEQGTPNDWKRERSAIHQAYIAWGIPQFSRSEQSTCWQAARKESQIESGLDQLREEITQSHICGSENYLQKECPRGNKQAIASETLEGKATVWQVIERLGHCFSGQRPKTKWNQ